MSRFPSLETRSLKRKVHCPPDVYVQREEQKEDLMSEDFVRDGYKYTKPVRDEYDSCKKESKFLNADSLWRFCHDVIKRKSEFTHSQDFKKKQSLSLRDSFVPIIDINKGQISDWFKELGGSTPLQNLGRRVPYSKDKEEILNEVVENKVSISRAVWLVNISVMHTTAHAETTKRKPRAPFDPTSDWTGTICRMLERILEQLCSDPSDSSLHDDWDYLFTLLVALYDADIADHWEVLVWLVKRTESIWKLDNNIIDSQSCIGLPVTEGISEFSFLYHLKFFLHYLLMFGFRLTENELITRRLLFWCCNVFSRIIFGGTHLQPNQHRTQVQLVLDTYENVCECPAHRAVLLALSSLITALALKIPSALVWNGIPFDTEHSYLVGSPLDVIPYSLSLLPMPTGPEATSIRKFLFELEDVIITRSKLVEVGWNCHAIDGPDEKHVKRLAKVLEVLDIQDYYVVRDNNHIDYLFTRIFNDESINVDTSAVVNTLCEWAVSVHRVGIYRSIIVACLLEKLNNTFRSNPVSCSMLQSTLIHFLDSFALTLPPFTSDQAPIDNQQMRSLVCLFSELIDREVFDHDNYVRWMIARGIFSTVYHPLASEGIVLSNHGGPSNVTTTPQASCLHVRAQSSSNLNIWTNLPNSSTAQCSVTSELSEDNDRCSMDNPDSVRSELGLGLTALGALCHSSASCSDTTTGRSPHFHYLAQFSLPQDESYSHEENQRCQLLYGSLRARDRARSRVRQLVRDISKLFTRKLYLIDVVHGEMCRRKKFKERDRDKDLTHTSNLPNISGHRPGDESHSIDKLHEDIMSRFISLSYHDMECVISHCIPTFVKMLSGCNNASTSGLSGDEHTYPPSTVAGTNNPPSPVSSLGPTSVSTTVTLSHIYMPVPSSIFLFFDLIEHSLNITCLISTIVDTLERLQVLFEPRTHFMTLYVSFLFLRAVGVLQRYQPVLYSMSDLSSRLFPTLIAQVLRVKEPTQCAPFERCILAYINDLFESNFVIRYRFLQSYGKAHPKVAVLFLSVDPCEGVGDYDPEYASDLLKGNVSDNLSRLRAYCEDLRNNASSRFSFVCRAIIFVCQATTNERANYLCGLCAELTSQCPKLTPEWLGSLYAVLAPRPYLHCYAPIVNAVGPSDVNMYDNLSSLIGTLLSRHCFTIGDFLRRVICPAMAQGLDQPVGPQLEPSIRLACHLLHRLFTAESTVSSLQTASNVLTPNREMSTISVALPSSLDASVVTPTFQISEPLLLTGALQKVTPELLVDVLKMLMVHNDKAGVEDSIQSNSAVDNTGEEADVDYLVDGDTEGYRLNDGTDSETEDDADGINSSGDISRRKRPRYSQRSNSGTRSRKKHRIEDGRDVHTSRGIHFIVQRFLDSAVLPTITELRSVPLSGLIQLVLREICTVSWVRDRFHRMLPKKLVCQNVLIDEKFSPAQARRLLHIIFFPFDTAWTDASYLAAAMCDVLGSLQLWTLRCSHMKFQLFYEQIPFSQKSDVLGLVAQAVVRGFQTQAIDWLTANGTGLSIDGSCGPIGGLSNFELSDHDPAWLLSSLVPNLPKSFKVQIVKATSETLKGIKQFWKHKNDEEKENVLLQNSVILAHPAFFALLKVCLVDADPLDSLYEQIDYFVENARETEDRVPDNLRTRQIVQECLRLRLTVVGQRFKVLQSDFEASTRWALLLTQLISHGVTEPESNSTLFYMVYDMLQTLVHTLAAKSDLEGKHYQNFVKKVRRELAERPSSYGIEQIRPLLPPLKGAYTIIVTGRTTQRTNSSGSASSSLSGAMGMNANKAGGSGKSSSVKGSGKASSGHGSSGGGGHINGPRGHGNKRGLTIVAKERMAPWDAQDPSKQHLLLSMHGATQTEAIPSRTEEQANRLIRHDHFILMSRSPDFYLTPVYANKDMGKNDISVSVDESKVQSSVRIKYESPVPSIQNSAIVSPGSCSQTSLPSSSVHKPSTAIISSSRSFPVALTDMKQRSSNTYTDHLNFTDPDAGESLLFNESQRSSSMLQRQECPNTYNLSTDTSGMNAYAFQQMHSEYVPNPTSNHVLIQSDSSALSRHLTNAHLPQSVEQSDGLLSDSVQFRHAQVKRRFVGGQERGLGGVADNPPELQTTAKVMRVASKYMGDPPVSSVLLNHPVNSGTSVAPKRKRGVNRRGSSANVVERATPMCDQRPGRSLTQSIELPNSKMPSALMVDYQSGSVRRPTAELDVDVPTDNFLSSSGSDSQPPNRTSVPMANFRGFIRSRAQQQQQQRSNLTPIQQPQSYLTLADSNIPHPSDQRGPLTGVPTYSSAHTMHGDATGTLSYSSSGNGFVAADARSTCSFIQSVPLNSSLTEHNSQLSRQFANGPSAVQRYTNQQQSNTAGIQPIVGGHQLQQQTVPNPPPYPVAQQHPGNTSAQPHTFPRAPDDSYMFTVESNMDDSFCRTTTNQSCSGVPVTLSLYRQPTYPGTSHPSHTHSHPQQSHQQTDQMPSHLVHQAHPVVYQRVVTTGQHGAPQNVPTQQQYSRFIPY